MHRTRYGRRWARVFLLTDELSGRAEPFQTRVALCGGEGVALSRECDKFLRSLGPEPLESLSSEAL